MSVNAGWLSEGVMLDLVKELVEPSRRAILSELKTGPKTVGDLVASTGLKQPNVSNHLARLKGKKILKSSKVGRKVYYSYGDPEIARAALSLIRSPMTSERKVEFGDETTRAFTRAACQGDESVCTEMVDSLIRSEQTLLHIYARLFAESLEMIGQWWSVKAIDEGQEHLATAIIERLMARVLHSASPTKNRPHKALLGCVEGNWHSIGIRMISDVMRLAGWKTIYLGANVPTPAFLAAVKEHSPSVVMVSCSQDAHIEAGLSLISSLREAKSEEPLVIGTGGHGFASRHSDVIAAGADFCCRDVSQFSEIILPRLCDEEAGFAAASAGR